VDRSGEPNRFAKLLPVPRLDISRALELAADLRHELRRLATDAAPCQREALDDALGCLEQLELDLQDAAPAEGEHPGDSL